MATAERSASVERKTRWVDVAIAVAGFVVGIDVIQKNLVAGAAILLGSYWVLKNSRY
ncbi:MAG: hypothetical protein HYU80_02330 [Candidatus Blackburnbacteria bacterium]|nr:hypothetical protein [Candidatus Blackburnbacteria bacterium]